MKFIYDPALQEYMKKQGKDTIVVELVEINNSDLEVSELHIQLVDQKRAQFFREKKRYRSVDTEHGTVLLPRYPLQVAETVTFGLKSFLCFRYVTCKGIKV